MFNQTVNLSILLTRKLWHQTKSQDSGSLMSLIFQVEVLYEAQTLNNNKILMLNWKFFPPPFGTKMACKPCSHAISIGGFFPNPTLARFCWGMLRPKEMFFLNRFLSGGKLPLTFFFCSDFFLGGIFPKKQRNVVFYSLRNIPHHQIWKKKVWWWIKSDGWNSGTHEEWIRSWEFW